MSRINRDKVLSHLSNRDDIYEMARVLDKVEEALRAHNATYSDFLDPFHRQLVEDILVGIHHLSFIFAGGFSDAERQRVVFTPDYRVPLEDEANIVILHIKGNFRFVQVTHRDFLGSLMGLGLKREKMGDIIVLPDGCYVACDGDAAKIITSQLSQVHKVTVEVKQVALDVLVLPEEPPKVIETTLSSLRLDAVIATGFGLSRAVANDAISGQKVKVNWSLSTKPGQQVSAGDVISLRGRGRLKFIEEKGLTKKGRVAVILHKMK